MELSGHNESQQSSTANLHVKRLINNENKRIGDLISRGGRSMSQVRQRARKTERYLNNKKQ